MERPATWIILLSALGFLITVLRPSVSLVKWVYKHFLRPAKNLNKYGSWAVVTGSTDGIGKAIAFQLARQGLNLVLVGRNPKKLEQVSGAIEAEFAKSGRIIMIKSVVVDFSGDLMTDGILRLGAVIQGLEVGVLINSAGVAFGRAMYLHEVDEEEWRNAIKVNMEGLTKVTRLVLPSMVERKNGAIVNIGSPMIPSFPLFSIYTATKAYVDCFSRSLYVEYKNKGIDVQCQVPLCVSTKVISIFTPLLERFSFFIPSPDTYARAAVRWIGYEPRCTPYWAHSLQWCFVSFIPDSVLNPILLRISIIVRKAN